MLALCASDDYTIGRERIAGLFSRRRERLFGSSARGIGSRAIGAFIAGTLGGRGGRRWRVLIHMGIYTGKFLGRLHSAHRTAVLWMTGTRPAVVNHENRNRADNRWTNLCPSSTEATRAIKVCPGPIAAGRPEFTNLERAWIARCGTNIWASLMISMRLAAERLAEQAERGFNPNHGAAAPHRDAHA